MPGTRTGSLWSFVTAALVAAVIVTPLPASPAAAAATGFAPADIVFPVAGPATFTNDFGDPRSGGRTHQGNDLMTGVKGVPIVAAHDGTVAWIGASCCSLALDHGNGWETWYIHLDNDTPGTDDGLGWGIADGLQRGTPVRKGQLIGWSGDSGNAEETPPHLHFEIRRKGTAVNPYRFLVAAPRLETPVGGWRGQFSDDDGSVHEANIEELYRRGITRGCNPPGNDRFCPNDHITRGQMAAFLRRHLELPPAAAGRRFSDIAGSRFEGDIAALAAAGIAFGCGGGRFCPDAPLRREEMAELLVRTFAPGDPDRYAARRASRFGDAAGSEFAQSINRLGVARVAMGCNPPANDRFCPEAPLSRAQMASFMMRALTP